MLNKKQKVLLGVGAIVTVAGAAYFITKKIRDNAANVGGVDQDTIDLIKSSRNPIEEDMVTNKKKKKKSSDDEMNVFELFGIDSDDTDKGNNKGKKKKKKSSEPSSEKKKKNKKEKSHDDDEFMDPLLVARFNATHAPEYHLDGRKEFLPTASNEVADVISKNIKNKKNNDIEEDYDDEDYVDEDDFEPEFYDPRTEDAMMVIGDIMTDAEAETVEVNEIEAVEEVVESEEITEVKSEEDDVVEDTSEEEDEDDDPDDDDSNDDEDYDDEEDYDEDTETVFTESNSGYTLGEATSMMFDKLRYEDADEAVVAEIDDDGEEEDDDESDDEDIDEEDTTLTAMMDMMMIQSEEDDDEYDSEDDIFVAKGLDGYMSDENSGELIVTEVLNVDFTWDLPQLRKLELDPNLHLRRGVVIEYMMLLLDKSCQGMLEKDILNLPLNKILENVSIINNDVGLITPVLLAIDILRISRRLYISDTVSIIHAVEKMDSDITVEQFVDQLIDIVYAYKMQENNIKLMNKKGYKSFVSFINSYTHRIAVISNILQTTEADQQSLLSALEKTKYGVNMELHGNMSDDEFIKVWTDIAEEIYSDYELSQEDFVDECECFVRDAFLYVKHPYAFLLSTPSSIVNYDNDGTNRIINDMTTRYHNGKFYINKADVKALIMGQYFSHIESDESEIPMSEMLHTMPISHALLQDSINISNIAYELFFFYRLYYRKSFRHFKEYINKTILSMDYDTITLDVFIDIFERAVIQSKVIQYELSYEIDVNEFDTDNEYAANINDFIIHHKQLKLVQNLAILTNITYTRVLEAISADDVSLPGYNDIVVDKVALDSKWLLFISNLLKSQNSSIDKEELTNRTTTALNVLKETIYDSKYCI